MARTVKAYLDLMRHALGKSPAAGHVLIDTFNDAGRALVNAHTWRWRNSPPVLLPIEANLDYVLLPADFGQIKALHTENSQVFQVIQTTMEDIQRRRNWQEYDPGALFISFDASDRQLYDDNHQPHRRAEIYPRQSAARSDVSMTYLRTWIDMSEHDENRVPEIPASWERSLVLFARAFAVDIENQVQPYENQALFGPSGEIARLIAEDAGRQTNFGRPKHSVMASTRGRAYLYPHRRIGF